MKVSYNWLNDFFDGELPAVEAVGDALTFHAFEIDGIEKVGNDSVLDVKITPNRGHDCLSSRGIAKELSAILKLPLSKDPFSLEFDLSKQTGAVTVAIEDSNLCSRYIAGYFKNVKIGPSPEWLKSSLETIGQRSINNVVDATNLVMFNTGQPLHAFDAKRLGSLAIGVRAARAGEVMEALDKKTYELDPSLLVITAADRPVGIAGIKGGMADKIDEETTDILIEAATFNGVAIRKGSQALKLRTDASARFEQGISPEVAAVGMRQMAKLLTEAMGATCEGFVDVYPVPQQQTYASVTVEKVNALLGTALTGAEVADAFVRLGLPYKEEAGVFEVRVPQERLDISIPEDLVEEVGRIVGYDRVPAVPLPPPTKPAAINGLFAAAEAAREELVAQGYSEVFTSVFTDKGERAVANKIGGEKPYLRSSLVPGLEEALKKNIPNKDLLGLKEVKLFEIGSVWKGGKEAVAVGTISEKTKGEERRLEPIAAADYGALPLSEAARFEAFSKYPYIVRDIAMWVPNNTDEGETGDSIKQTAGPLCVSVRPFDRFEKGEKTSLAFRLVFQSFEKTLTEAEANSAMEGVAAALKAKGFEIR